VAPSPSRLSDVLVLSARSEEALERATDALADHLARHPEQSLSRRRVHLADGRPALSVTAARIICSPGEDAASLLRRRDPERVLTQFEDATGRTDRTGFDPATPAFESHGLANLWLQRWPSRLAGRFMPASSGAACRCRPTRSSPRRYWLDAPGVPRPLGLLDAGDER